MKKFIRCLIIDTMPKGDSPYEGEIVKSFMKNLGWDVRLVMKPPKNRVLKELYGGYKYDIIHLACHGDKDRIPNRSGWITVREVEAFFKARLKEDQIHLDDTKLVMNTGCYTGKEKWVKLFLDELRAQNYIAPQGNVKEIEEGILFPLTFYMRFAKSKKVKTAYDYARKHYKCSGDWILAP